MQYHLMRSNSGSEIFCIYENVNFVAKKRHLLYTRFSYENIKIKEEGAWRFVRSLSSLNNSARSRKCRGNNAAWSFSDHAAFVLSFN
ncbi:MAG: hypothetical protein QM689_03480 [Oscillospiraceae bacterium]